MAERQIDTLATTIVVSLRRLAQPFFYHNWLAQQRVTMRVRLGSGA